MKDRYFPLFVPAKGRKVIVFGGGNIATRRVLTLKKFDFSVTVVSPEFTDTLETLGKDGEITCIRDTYKPSYIDGQFMAIACTDERKTNRDIGICAKERGCLVSVCDSREECSFYFPAIAAGEEVTAGIAGDGSSHRVTKKAAAAVRKIIEGKEY